MITAVDTNVIIDIVMADKNFGATSRETLKNCLRQGAVIASGIVWVEMAPMFSSQESCAEAMHTLGILFSSITKESFFTAGAAWKTYKLSGGKKQRVLADFLIGAHALTECDRLLTRDRGFYREYFKSLQIVEPAH